jgi:predicted TIM-barrel fold metal-dependent hydrolase
MPPRLLIAVLLIGALPLHAQGPPRVDHHQHLFSPALAEFVSQPFPASPFNPITADDLIAQLDAAGIERAVVLSTAYVWSQPSRNVEDDYPRVRGDNDWTSLQVSRYPDRLIGFCAIDPMKPYALEEMARCAKDPFLRAGVKIHIGNSTPDYRNAEHVARLRTVFRAANDHRLAIVVHMRSSLIRQLPFGRAAALVFLDELVAAAPDVPIQIAHLAGAGGYTDPAVDEAVAVFVEAIERGDPRMARIWFDVSGVAIAPLPRERAALLARRLRQLGLQRIIYGSDASPSQAWAQFRRLPLSEAEFRTIAGNVAPYLLR